MTHDVEHPVKYALPVEQRSYIILYDTHVRARPYSLTAPTSDASISLFRFRFDIDTILMKYRDIDIDIW